MGMTFGLELQLESASAIEGGGGRSWEEADDDDDSWATCLIVGVIGGRATSAVSSCDLPGATGRGIDFSTVAEDRFRAASETPKPASS